MMKRRIGYTALIIAITFLLSGCFDAEINTELKGDGGGRITIICIANPIYAGAFQGKTIFKDAKVRNYIRGDRFYHEESFVVKSLDDVRLEGITTHIYIHPTNPHLTIIEQRFSPSSYDDPLLAGMFVGRKITCRLFLPQRIYRAFSANIKGVDIEPVVKGKVVSWQAPYDLFLQTKHPVSFKVEVYGEKEELFSSWEDKALSWFKQFFQKEEKEIKQREKQGYFVVVDGKQYKVEGDIFTGRKEGRVFKDEEGTIVRDLVLAKKIAQAAWVYENIVRPSGPPSSQQVSAILDIYKAVRRYETVQDVLARVSVQVLAATISGGATLTYKVPVGLTWRVVHDQFFNLKGLLSLTGRYGLEEALSKYQQMESLIAKLKPNQINETTATEIKTLYDSAYGLSLPYSALLASLMPKRGRELVDKALKDIGDELVKTLPVSDKAISDAVLTNRELFDLQGKMDDALKTDPALKEYYEKLNLAKRLIEASEQTIAAWAEQAVQIENKNNE